MQCIVWDDVTDFQGDVALYVECLILHFLKQ